MTNASPFTHLRSLALLMVATLTVLSNATISPALPGLEAAFADTPNAAFVTRLLVTAPSLTVALLAPIAGLLVDRLGGRRLLILGVLVYALAGTAGFWLGDLHAILASRFVLGLAVALTMTSQTALIGHYFAGEQRAQFMGYQLAATNFSGFLFVGAAGFIAGYSPQWPFLIYGIALLYLPLIWASVKDPERPVPGGDIGHGGSPETAWKGQLAFVAMLATSTFILFYIVPTQLPFHLADIGLPDPAVSGQVIAILTLVGGVTALLFGRIRVRLGTAWTPAAGYAAMAIGFLVFQASSSVPAFLLGGAISGLGVGLVMPNFATLALQAVPAERRGIAGGVLTTAIFLGQFLSPVLSQPLLGLVGFPQLFGVASLVLVGLSVVTWSVLRFAFNSREARQ
ncbi:MAG: MFS transporter [Methylorubrum populi]